MAYIGNTVQNQGFTPAIDYFNGNGVTVTFTLSRPVVSVAQMIVAIDNVIQNPSSAFTVSGNSITFTSAPLSGTNNIWVEYTSLITQYNAISQDPSVIGDITATGGYLATGDFGNTFTDGTIVDYVTGMSRITTGSATGMTFYNGGPSARNPLIAINSSGNVGIGSTTSNGDKLRVSSSGSVATSGNMNTGVIFQAGDGSQALNFVPGTTNSINSAFSNNAGVGSGLNFLIGGVAALTMSPTGVVSAVTPATGTNTTQLATTAFAYQAASLNGSGYAKLPSGLICQFGSFVSSGSTSYTATLPITFPNAVFFALVCNGEIGVNGATVGTTTSSTTSTITLNPSNNSLIRINYMVWGH
jgi:hypothetical protein